MSDSVPPPLPTSAPILSNPEDVSLFTLPPDLPRIAPRYNVSDDEFKYIYEIEQTAREIHEKGYKRIALQFPDELLGDSSRVYSLLWEGLRGLGGDLSTSVAENEKSTGTTVRQNCCSTKAQDSCGNGGCANCESSGGSCGNCGCSDASGDNATNNHTPPTQERKLFILADTSYGACCVDEIAAEHANADAVVHYGRACLSPTSRLPVIHVFTISSLSIETVLSTFRALFPPETCSSKKILLMADVTYISYLPAIYSALTTLTTPHETLYTNLFLTKVIHNPSSPLPNRTLPPTCQPHPDDTFTEKATKANELRTSWELFHISTPLPTLLLVLSSRVHKIHIFPTDQNPPTTPGPLAPSLTTPLDIAPLLRRRYALLTRLKSAGIIGILVSTLSVQHYLPLVTFLKRMIRAAHKKSYLIVVGKVNVEKLANFSEIEGWVGIGCWEQGVVGGALTDGMGGRGFYRPIVTPWELGVALRWLGKENLDSSDAKGGSRGGGFQWGSEWITDFKSLLNLEEDCIPEPLPTTPSSTTIAPSASINPPPSDTDPTSTGPDSDSEPESSPPEFDLRTGRYISTSKPLSHLPQNNPSQSTTKATKSLPSASTSTSTSLIAISKPSTLTTTNTAPGGVFSPSALFNTQNRSWRGLGSERRGQAHTEIGYEEEEEDEREREREEGALVQQGRGGVARGYVELGGEGVGKV